MKCIPDGSFRKVGVKIEIKIEEFELANMRNRKNSLSCGFAYQLWKGSFKLLMLIKMHIKLAADGTKTFFSFSSGFVNTLGIESVLIKNVARNDNNSNK